MKYYLSAVNDYYKQFVIFQPPGQLEGSTVVLDLVQSGGKKKKRAKNGVLDNIA